MKIIILGCGYIGYNIAQYFHQNGKDVIVLGLDSYYVSLLSTSFININVFQLEQLDEIDFEGAIVIDAMTLIQQNRIYENKEEVMQRVETQYMSLYQYLNEKKIKQFVTFSSGGTVYGNSEKLLKETDTLNPNSFFASSKVKLEYLLQESKLPYLIIRLANPYGGIQEVDKIQGVIPVLIKKALNREVFHLWGELDAIRDYIYISDFCDALERLFQTEQSMNQIVNVGVGIGTSLQELVVMIETITQEQIRVEKQETVIPTIKKNVLDISKLKEMTGFEPRVDIQEGVFYEIERIR